MLLDLKLRTTRPLLLFTLMLLAGCGAGSGSNVPETPGASDDTAGLSLPAPEDLRQLSAAADSPFSNACDFDMDLPYSRVSPQDEALHFIPEKDFETGQISPAYAMYRLRVPDYPHETVLQIETANHLADHAWVGFANFERNRWDWQAFQDEQLPNYQNAYDPEIHVRDNEIVIAVVATSIISLQWLVAGDTTQPYITNVQPKLITTGEQVQLTAEFLYSPATTYQWDLGDGLLPGYSNSAAPVATAQGPGTYSGSLNVTNALGTDSFDFSYEIALASDVSPLHLEAIPSQTEASVGEPVLVTIRCGNFSQQEKMSNCKINLLVSEYASYVPDSFNVGSPGGERYDIDGLWSLAPEPPSDWVACPDEWFKMLPAGTPGLARLEVAASPIEGSNTTIGGDIFNIQLAFDQPGVYELGFMPNDSLLLTVYYDEDNHAYSWYDISNDAAPSITVTQ